MKNFKITSTTKRQDDRSVIWEGTADSGDGSEPIKRTRTFSASEVADIGWESPKWAAEIKALESLLADHVDNSEEDL